MNIKQLEAFARVVETKSFSRTAKELHLTQPTISAHIASLEKELGERLLVRNTKEVHPTARGELLYSYARRMTDLQSELLREFGKQPDPGSSALSIAASTIPSQYILPDALSAFGEAHSVAQYTLTEGDSASVIELVAAHSVDIGLVGTIIKNPHCEYIPFYRDRLVVIAPNTERYRAIQPGGFTADMLLKSNVILREEGSGTRREVEKYLSKLGVDAASLNSIACISNQETIKKTVSSGMGISVLSALAAQDYLEDGKLLAFDMTEGAAYRSLNIVYNRDYALTASAQQFVEFLVKRYEGYDSFL